MEIGLVFRKFNSLNIHVNLGLLNLFIRINKHSDHALNLCTTEPLLYSCMQTLVQSMDYQIFGLLNHSCMDYWFFLLLNNILYYWANLHCATSTSSQFVCGMVLTILNLTRFNIRHNNIVLQDEAGYAFVIYYNRCSMLKIMTSVAQNYIYDVI